MSDAFTLEDIIYTNDARRRMAELTPPTGGIDTDAYLDWHDEHGDEYRLILDFRMGVIGAFGLSFWDTDRNLSFVAGSHMGDYAQDRAEDIYGEAAKTDFWDVDKWTAHCESEMISFLVGDEEYWGDGER